MSCISVFLHACKAFLLKYISILIFACLCVDFLSAHYTHCILHDICTFSACQLFTCMMLISLELCQFHLHVIDFTFLRMPINNCMNMFCMMICSLFFNLFGLRRMLSSSYFPLSLWFLFISSKHFEIQVLFANHVC